jgi:transposase InsO family protein
MTAWLRREGHAVVRCTVDRLMRDEALNGLARGRKPKAGAAAKDPQRAPDLLNRDFTAARPNAVWVTDFTYVRTWAGFVYVAFAIDVFSRAIVGWHGSTIKDTDLVLTTLKMALWRRDQAGTPVPAGMVHHSDAGSQGGFNENAELVGSWWPRGYNEGPPMGDRRAFAINATTPLYGYRTDRAER